MKQYYYIIKNSYRELHHSFWVVLLNIPQSLAEVVSFAFFYKYIIGNSYTQELILYFLFILCASSSRLPTFAIDVQDHIQSESYINIEKLPLNPFFYYLLKSLGRNAINFSLYTFSSLIYMLYLHLPLLEIFLFIPTLFIAIILSHTFYFILGCVTFYTESSSIWLFRSIFDFLSGRWIPIPYTPPFIRITLYLLPFSYAYGALAKEFSNFHFTSWLFSFTIALVWTYFALLLSRRLWNSGSYHFQENG